MLKKRGAMYLCYKVQSCNEQQSFVKRTRYSGMLKSSSFDKIFKNYFSLEMPDFFPTLQMFSSSSRVFFIAEVASANFTLPLDIMASSLAPGHQQQSTVYRIKHEIEHGEVPSG